MNEKYPNIFTFKIVCGLNNPVFSLRDLRKSLNMDYNTVMFQIRYLIGQGLVDKTYNDGRSYKYELTENGQELRRRIDSVNEILN